MEIGTWNGERAIKMINKAKEQQPADGIDYFGFDLFDEMDQATLKEELSKIPPSEDEVRTKLKETGANIHLFKGDTRDIFENGIKKLPTMDFVFIDGGHSLETIRNDWNYTKKLMDKDTVVIFDDYYQNINEKGCKKIIDTLNREEFSVDILEPMNSFEKEWGTLNINFVRVVRKQY